MLDSLGGPNVRYVRTQQNIDLNQMNQQIRWVVERVWPVLDGSLPLTKMSERLGVDTYTAMQAIWEMKNAGLIAMANFEQYHRSGQLGPALVPGHDVDLNFWDNLQGFYLDELSTGPVTMQGNYFGSTHLLQPTTLLHTMSVASKYGAVVLKEGRLVGLHNGKFMANLSSPPPFPLSKMAWIGTLSDMSAKRMRAATAELETDLGEEGLGVRGALTGAKARQILSSAAEVLTNSAPPPSEIGGPLVPSNEPEVLRKFNKIQMGVGGAGLGLVIGMIFAVVFMSPKTPVVVPVPAVQPSQSSSATGTGTGDAAPKVAPSGELFKQTLRLTAVKDIPIGDFKFVDTSKDTGNKPSFGLESESLNQRIIFVVWPDIRIQASVDNNMSQPPFIPVKALVDIMSTKDSARGSLPFRDFYYRVHHYYNTSDKDTMAFVAAYTSNEPDKSVLIVAMPLKGEGQLDYLNTINMVQRMININSGDAASNAAGNNGSTAAPVVATAEDIQAYRQKVGDIIKAVYKNPADADRASTKCQVKFVIDSTGNISKLELKYTAGMDEVDKAVQKAITSSVPFPPPPSGIRGGQAEMLVTLEPGASELTISEP